MAPTVGGIAIASVDEGSLSLSRFVPADNALSGLQLGRGMRFS